MIKLLLVILVSRLSLSDACSCLPIVLKEAYCNSQFAGIIKVLDSGSSCVDGLGDGDVTDTCYPIRVVQRFRGAETKATVLRTAENSAACGVWLMKGHTYFVGASTIDYKTLGLSLCQLNNDLTELTPKQRSMHSQETLRIKC